MQQYTLTIGCDCGGEMEVVIGDITANPGDEIRIDVGMAVSQTTFTCRDCGDQCHTGDFSDICFGADDF